MTCCAVVLVAAVVISSAAFISADFTCKVQRFGKLTQFKDDGVGNNLELPCKYKMARVIAGGFKVKVTVTSGLDPGSLFRFSPFEIKVNVVNDTDNSKQWIAKANCETMKTAEVGTAAAWEVKREDFTPDVVNLNTTRFAIVKQNGVFKVTFSCPYLETDDITRGVEIKVYSLTMVSSPYPQYMCGNGTSEFSFLQRRQELFNDTSLATNRSMVFNYDILDREMSQGPECKNISAKFRDCPVKAEAVKICTPVYGRRPLSECLMDVDNPQTDFLNCLTAVCDTDVAACQAVNDKIANGTRSVCRGLDPVAC